MQRVFPHPYTRKEGVEVPPGVSQLVCLLAVKFQRLPLGFCSQTSRWYYVEQWKMEQEVGNLRGWPLNSNNFCIWIFGSPKMEETWYKHTIKRIIYEVINMEDHSMVSETMAEETKWTVNCSNNKHDRLGWQCTKGSTVRLSSPAASPRYSFKITLRTNSTENSWSSLGVEPQ